MGCVNVLGGKSRSAEPPETNEGLVCCRSGNLRPGDKSVDSHEHSRCLLWRYRAVAAGTGAAAPRYGCSCMRGSGPNCRSFGRCLPLSPGIASRAPNPESPLRSKLLQSASSFLLNFFRRTGAGKRYVPSNLTCSVKGVSIVCIERISEVTPARLERGVR